jgi:hypothetical protein
MFVLSAVANVDRDGNRKEWIEMKTTQRLLRLAFLAGTSLALLALSTGSVFAGHRIP